MKGKLFELFVQKLLLHAGFSKVKSDGNYIFDSGAGQMIQGLGQAHNADVLMEPPVQTPFYFPTRIVIECKDYKNKTGLNVIRSAFGLREDINAFEYIDIDVLNARKNTRRTRPVYIYPRFLYQVAVASSGDFSLPAKEFALAHRIPLMSFHSLPCWSSLLLLLDSLEKKYPALNSHEFCINNEDGLRELLNNDDWERFNYITESIAERIALAITPEGYMLFLYSDKENADVSFDDDYFHLTWQDTESYWKLSCGDNNYLFELPKEIAEEWLKGATTYDKVLENAITCKYNHFSHLIVYHVQNGAPKIKILSIDHYRLQEAYNELKHRNNNQ